LKNQVTEPWGLIVICVHILSTEFVVNAQQFVPTWRISILILIYQLAFRFVHNTYVCQYIPI